MTQVCRRSIRVSKSYLDEKVDDEMKVQLQQDDDRQLQLEVRKIYLCGIEQRGVFTAKYFRKKSFVIEYSGNLLSGSKAREMEKYYEQYKNVGSFMFFFSFKQQTYCVDSTQETSRMGRLINHSIKIKT